MSLFKKILGSGKSDEAPAAKAPPAPGQAPVPAAAPTGAAIDIAAGASERLPTEGIHWNEEAMRRFAAEGLPRWEAEIAALPAKAPRPGEFALDNPFCPPPCARVLYAAICEFAPTRIIEVGCGYSTHVIRKAMQARNLPAELIAIDPQPRIEVGEVCDAQLVQPVQEIPLSDFTMLMAGEMLVLDTTHIAAPGGEVNYLYQRVLPALTPGVFVGIHGIRLPFDYSVEERRLGWNEQGLLQLFLFRNPQVEVLWCGGGSAGIQGGPHAELDRWLWMRILEAP